jgi:predicted dehydrogenase
VNIARRVAGEDPEDVDGYARFDDRDVERTFVGILRFPSGLLAHFESGFAAADRERVEIVGSAATLVLASPFLPAPDGPPASVVVIRDGERIDIEVPSVDQYRLEVDDLHAAIAGEKGPHVDLAFSRGTIATLERLEHAARAHAGSAAPA